MQDSKFISKEKIKREMIEIEVNDDIGVCATAKNCFNDLCEIIDEESYTSAKELFEAIQGGGDWLYGYRLEDTPGLINILSYFLTATDPEYGEEQEPDETVISFLKYLNDNKEDIEKDTVGNICVFSMNDGDPLEIDGLRFNKGAVTKLSMELYDENDEAEAFFDLQGPEDVDEEALDNLFESNGKPVE